jgi:hypothetical protein
MNSSSMSLNVINDETVSFAIARARRLLADLSAGFTPGHVTSQAIL